MHNVVLLCKDAYHVIIYAFLFVDVKNLSEVNAIWEKCSATGYVFRKSGLV